MYMYGLFTDPDSGWPSRTNTRCSCTAVVSSSIMVENSLLLITAQKIFSSCTIQPHIKYGTHRVRFPRSTFSTVLIATVRCNDGAVGFFTHTVHVYGSKIDF